MLDVACGRGRHCAGLLQRGHAVTGVDRSPEAVAAAQPLGRMVLADIENGPWPFDGERFDAVVVTNYLWRPLLPALVDSLAPGGVLLYETFAAGNESRGQALAPRLSAAARRTCCRPAKACTWWPMKMVSAIAPNASSSASPRCENGLAPVPPPGIRSDATG